MPEMVAASRPMGKRYFSIGAKSQPFVCGVPWKMLSDLLLRKHLATTSYKQNTHQNSSDQQTNQLQLVAR